MKTTIYKGFVITIEVNKVNNDQRCVAYKDNEPKFGTYSDYNKHNAFEKMITKIENHLKNQ